MSMSREEAIRDIEECVIPYVGGISLRMAVEDMKAMDRLSKENTKNDSTETWSREWGKWVISEVRCPECLEYFDPEGFSKEEMDKCPNCGADMRKEGDKE